MDAQDFGNNLTYAIESVHSGKVMDLSHDEKEFGNLIVYDRHGGANQRFQLIVQPDHNNQILIKSMEGSKVLAVENDSTQNGAIIRGQLLEQYHGQQKGKQSQTLKPSQLFRFQEISPGSRQFIIYTFCGKVIDCCQAGKSNGTKIIQWSFHGMTNQIWQIIPI